MNEDQIERKVERATDYLDRQFLAGVYDQATYDRKMGEITAWAEHQYTAARRQAQKHRDEFRRRCRQDHGTDTWAILEVVTANAMRNLGN